MFKHMALLTALVLPTAALAQSETDLDDFGDLSDPGTTGASEKRELLEEADKEPEKAEKRKKRVIKTLQRKTFMKIGRTELSLGPAIVTNDPFINRYIVQFDATYHFTEVASIQVNGGYSPILDRADWKAITKQIIDENQVTPDISKIQFYGGATLQYAPIYGKVAAPGNKIINFDIYGLFGTGVAQTVDDLEALQAEQDEIALATEVQFHPTLNYGGGVRVIFGKNVAVRLEGRGLSYIEVLEGINLEMKNNLLVQANFSYFLGKGN